MNELPQGAAAGRQTGQLVQRKRGCQVREDVRREVAQPQLCLPTGCRRSWLTHLLVARHHPHCKQPLCDTAQLVLSDRQRVATHLSRTTTSAVYASRCNVYTVLRPTRRYAHKSHAWHVTGEGARSP